MDARTESTCGRNLISRFALLGVGLVEAGTGTGKLTPWVTTAALFAVNIALVAAVLGSPQPARAQIGESADICQECYQGIIPTKAGFKRVHATTWFNGEFGSAFGGAYLTRHNFGSFYSGACRAAHYDKPCCT